MGTGQYLERNVNQKSKDKKNRDKLFSKSHLRKLVF